MIELLKKIGFFLLDLIIFVVIAALVTASMFYIFQNVLPYDMGELSEEEALMDPLALLTQYFPLLIGVLVSGIIVHKYIFKRPLETFGISMKRFIPHYSWGLFLGALLIFIGFLVIRLLGYLDILEYNLDYSIIALFFIFFIVQSLFEEIAFRSYMMPAITDRFGLWVSLILSSILFAAIHLSNSNVNPLGIANIGLAGVLLGVLFIKYDSVWVASGLHCSWNYIQSTILGFEVSGEKTFNMIVTQENGPDIITGGKFGFEGSIISILLLSGLLGYYLLMDQEVKDKFKPKVIEEDFAGIDDHLLDL